MPPLAEQVGFVGFGLGVAGGGFERCARLVKRLRASRLDNSHDVEMRKLLPVDLLIIRGMT